MCMRCACGVPRGGRKIRRGTMDDVLGMGDGIAGCPMRGTAKGRVENIGRARGGGRRGTVVTIWVFSRLN